MERKFYYASARKDYCEHLKSSCKTHVSLRPLLEDMSKQPLRAIDVRQGLRDGTLRKLSDSVLSGGGFTETDEDRKELESYEKEQDEEKEEEKEY